MVSPAGGNLNQFLLPDLGEGLEEAELVEWCVRPGQRVEENDTLAKMETAKALVEVPSPRAGVIAELHGKPGQSIKVGKPLVTYKDEAPEARRRGTVVEATAAADAEPAQEQRESTPADKNGKGRRDAGTVVGNLDATDEAPADGKVLATPAVRRLARDLGVELEHVAGTGIGGRITAHDVEQAADGAATARDEAAAPEEHEAPPQHRPARPKRKPPASAAGPPTGTQRTPFRGVRKAIAEHLRYSVTHAVHFTVMDEVDVSALDSFRRKLVAASNEKISLLPLVAVAVCRVLSGAVGPQFMRLNSTVDDETEEIVQHRAVHLGVATDTESGLMVPVIRNAHRLGTLEISRKIAELARSARDRSLPPEQLMGSTFTISNFGSAGGRFGTPIINYPEAAILAIGRAREGVVVRDGMLGVGKLLPLSLSADHRVIDGATAATALAKIMQLLQRPDELLPPAGGGEESQG
jgi:pyruvate dehydrogenase E2 component (dihydrolipoamide acetyltransferase)